MTVPSASAMPAFAPLYAVGTERASLDWLTVVYRTDAGVVDSLLPPPLRRDGEAEVLIWVARFLSASFERDGELVGELPSYEQGGVCVRCARSGEAGAYPLVSYIAGLNHGFTGRELFGLPKKQAQRVLLDRTGQRSSAEILTTAGIPIVRIEAEDTGQAAELVPDWFTNQLSLKLIPSATGQGFDVNHLVRIPFEFSGQSGVTGLDARVELTASGADPLHLLPVREHVWAARGHTGLRVGYGTYLDQVTEIPTLGVPGT
ncbi:acetoacetate decarboxylase family protein [Sciscionella sediminilitoris]|uniref:acetoacetate decarboxylase family protein n=1 Tax=Sciscionella sediminilitoris TaxID=1445613 RepID=UPI0004DF99F6|nr:acetoacetate decarboxylase family protein [Sciscionella sp. SE31]